MIGEKAVEEDDPFLTSKGPGTAHEFGFALLKRLRGEAVAQRVRAEMLF